MIGWATTNNVSILTKSEWHLNRLTIQKETEKVGSCVVSTVFLVSICTNLWSENALTDFC